MLTGRGVGDVVNEGLIDGAKEWVDKDGEERASERAALDDSGGKVKEMLCFLVGGAPKGKDIAVDFSEEVMNAQRETRRLNDKVDPVVGDRGEGRGEVEKGNEREKGGRK